MIFDIDCESKIGYVFKDKMLLRQCFTHASYGYEHGEKDNELLEFFGDAIIEFVVTEHLYKNTSGDEGKLTKKRATVVSKEPLLKAVKKLGISEYVLLGKGQEKNASKEEKLYSSVYEALVAGIYLDGGLVPAKKFIKETLISEFIKQENSLTKTKKNNESKNAYQEYVQKNKLGSVGYETLSKIGPDHSPEFRVVATLNGTRIAEGKGLSIKSAEAAAATEALKRIKKQGGKAK